MFTRNREVGTDPVERSRKDFVENIGSKCVRDGRDTTDSMREFLCPYSMTKRYFFNGNNNEWSEGIR